MFIQNCLVMYLEQRQFAMGACNRISTQKQTIHLSSLMTALSQKLSAMSGKSLDSKTSSWIRTLTEFSPEHHTGRRTRSCCRACHPEVLGAPDMSLMMLSHIAWAAFVMTHIKPYRETYNSRPGCSILSPSDPKATLTHFNDSGGHI